MISSLHGWRSRQNLCVAHIFSDVPPPNVVQFYFMKKVSHSSRKFIFLFSPIAIISLILWPKLPTQDRPDYFDFVDTASLLGFIPNWQNVLSNIPFLFIGIVGIQWIRRNENSLKKNFNLAGIYFSVALLLTAFGSSYFHWEPNPQTLFWDRLPMALGFGALCSLITIDRLFPNLPTSIVNIICLLSLLTVINWGYGNHDLRLYLILQFVGGFYVLLVTVCTKSNILKNQTVFVSLGFYILAKILEVYDKQIFHMIIVSSGHALKHLSAAISAYLILNPWNKKSRSK